MSFEISFHNNSFSKLFYPKNETVKYNDDLSNTNEKVNRFNNSLGFNEYLKSIIVEKSITTELLNKKQTNDSVKKFRNKVIQLSLNEDLEFGKIGMSTKYVSEQLSKDKGELLQELQDIALENMDNKHLVYSIIHTFAHLEYDVVYPTGPVFALAMSRHEDIEIRDCSIQCFEMWNKKKSLNYLKLIKIEEEWLNEYFQEVIKDLEEEDE